MGVSRVYLFLSHLPILIFLLHFASIFCLGATLAMELSSFTSLFSILKLYLLHPLQEVAAWFWSRLIYGDPDGLTQGVENTIGALKAQRNRSDTQLRIHWGQRYRKMTLSRSNSLNRTNLYGIASHPSNSDNAINTTSLTVDRVYSFTQSRYTLAFPHYNNLLLAPLAVYKLSVNGHSTDRNFAPSH